MLVAFIFPSFPITLSDYKVSPVGLGETFVVTVLQPVALFSSLSRWTLIPKELGIKLCIQISASQSLLLGKPNLQVYHLKNIFFY